LFYSAIRWRVTPICISTLIDELRRAATSCDDLWISYCGRKYMLHYDWYFCRHITRIEMWMCKIVWHDELRRVATFCDELWISYCGGKYMSYCRCNEWHFCRHILDDLNVDVYIRATWRVATGCDELLISYCGGKYRLYFRCNDWYFCRHITRIEMWMCKIVWHDELRRYDEFEFRIAVESICRITNVMNDTFVVTY
jgi:hypothetical protein